MADKKPLVNSAGNAVEIAAGDTIPVANGGTGAATLTSHGVLLGNGTGAIAATAEGATGKVLVGVTGGNPVFGNWLPQVKFKSASQNVVSSTTLVDCTGMSFAIGSNEVWAGYLIPMFVAGASGGIKWAFTVPSGCTGRGYGFGGASSDGFSSADVDITSGGSRTAAYTTTGARMTLEFNVTNGSTAGTVQFQFAQATSNGTNTTVSKNAQLIVWRVS